MKADFENYSKKDPILILMNHASFIDIELGAVMFHPRPLNIVASNDAFLRKNWIMSHYLKWLLKFLSNGQDNILTILI